MRVMGQKHLTAGRGKEQTPKSVTQVRESAETGATKAAYDA